MEVEMPSTKLIQELSHTLTREVSERIFEEKYAGTEEVLKMVGAGLFLAASFVMPGLPRALKPLLNAKYKEEREAWKRFNLPYLQRSLKRLEKQKLVRTYLRQGKEMVELTKKGSLKILRLSLDAIEIEKPRSWNGRWYLVTYDVPRNFSPLRNTIKEYLKAWGFYKYHESAYLHAYPCRQELEFLRDYLGAGKYLRILEVSKIESDEPFRKYFGV